MRHLLRVASCLWEQAVFCHHRGAVAHRRRDRESDSGPSRGIVPTQGNVHGWLWFYFVNEHVLRYLNLRVPRDYDTVPLWLFWGLLLVWLMPWCVFAVQALARDPGAKALRREPLEQGNSDCSSWRSGRW